MHTKTKGDVAEQFVIAHCLARGWTVCKTVGDNSRYDIVIEKGDGVLKKVQVKTGKLNNGAVIVCAHSNGYNFKDGQPIYFEKKYKKEDVDYIASYCPETKMCYLLEFNGEGIYTLRIEQPKNGQTKHVRWAKDFEL